MVRAHVPEHRKYENECFRVSRVPPHYYNNYWYAGCRLLSANHGSSPCPRAKYVKSMDCIFCKIVSGEALCYKIWEDEKHLAFLSIFPNTKGFSVVVTKEHHPSYAFDLPDEVLSGLTIAAGKVAKLLDKTFDDVGRTGMIFEGFGVDHVHAKLFPMHGTKSESWRVSQDPNVGQIFRKLRRIHFIPRLQTR